MSSIVIPKSASPSRIASEAAKSLRSLADARSARAIFITPSKAAVKSEPPDWSNAGSNGSHPQTSSAPRISLAFFVTAFLSLSVIP